MHPPPAWAGTPPPLACAERARSEAPRSAPAGGMPAAAAASGAGLAGVAPPDLSDDDALAEADPEPRGARLHARGERTPSPLAAAAAKRRRPGAVAVPGLDPEAPGEAAKRRRAADDALSAEVEAGVAMAEELAAARRAPGPDEAAAATRRVVEQQPLRPPAGPFAFLQPVTEGSWRHVVAPAAAFMPPLRGTKVPHTPPGAAAPDEVIDIEPRPSTQHAHGTITLASPWMGGGKTTAKRHYQKELIRESPRVRTLDLDCNRIYATSNAVNLERTAAELRAEGLAHVTAAGYLDHNQNADLKHAQMVGCSFESLLKLDGQCFGLVTGDELSALALKIGGGTMPHFECVHVLRDLLARPGTRFLALDAAAAFKMSDTEPCTVVEHFLRLIAPHRRVLSVALDPASMPGHLKRTLRFHYGSDKAQEKAWWGRLEVSVREWQANPSMRIFVVVGTKTFGRAVASALMQHGVPYQFYNGDSNEATRFRDLADPGKWMAGLGGVVCTTVVGRGVDMPQDITFNRVHVAMDRTGCDFGDQFQSMLRLRHVVDPTVDVLLVHCLPPAQHALLVSQGKRKPIVRPTYEDKLQQQKQRRGYAIRAAEREARAVGVADVVAHATDPLLRVMAHATLNRGMQEVDPVYAVKRYAAYYGFPIVECAAAAAAAQAPRPGDLALDEDQAFADLMKPREKWSRVAKAIRERGEDGFLNDKCWALATDEKQKSCTLSSLELWLVRAYHALKHIGEVPEPREEGSEEQDEREVEDDPAATLLLDWLGGSDAADKTPALQLQAHCLVFSPEEQMRRDEAYRVDTQRSGKPGKHVHCETGLGLKMKQVERFGELLLPGGFRHVRQVFDTAGGIVNSANAELVAAANNEILQRPTPADRSLLQELQQIKAAMHVGGRGATLIEVLRALAPAMGLKLTLQYEQAKQPNGARLRLVRTDPGFGFERVLPEVVDKWLIWSPELDAKVAVSDWQQAHAEQQQERAEATWAGSDDTEDLFGTPFNPPADDGTVRGDASVRLELIPDGELQSQRRRLQAQYDAGAWMDATPQATRQQWSGPQRAQYRRHLSTTRALNAAKAIDREAGPVDEATGLRTLRVVYGKNSLDLGRRTATAPAMQNCPSALRRALCRALYRDVDIVSCHPTLMLQVVRKMEAVGALEWCDALDTLVGYAQLDDSGVPVGRMPLLLRVADHFGIDRGVAKDVCKPLVLRVLNGGQVSAWCREMGIAEPDEQQADLDDLVEVARVVRQAFFAMLERDHPGALQALQQRVWAHLQGKHERKKQDAQRKGEPPPPPPSVAKRDRTMFAHCIFNLEDAVLDCIDAELRALGWCVASLIYDGLHVRDRGGVDLTPALRAAETAVKEKLGYTIALSEKPLFDPDGVTPDGAHDAADAAADAAAAAGGGD